VLVADVVASDAQIAQLGDRRWRDLLDRYEVTTRRQVARFRGRHLKKRGDGILAIFDGPARAVSCACAIRDAAAQLGVEIRAGVHAGEVDRHGDVIGGMTVHIAESIAAATEPRQVVVSTTVVDLMVGSGIKTNERRQQRLTGVPGSWRLFEVEA
jgi:class 3 adenylate cyclase